MQLQRRFLRPRRQREVPAGEHEHAPERGELSRIVVADEGDHDGHGRENDEPDDLAPSSESVQAGLRGQALQICGLPRWQPVATHG
jgi:hypothetical protein